MGRWRCVFCRIVAGATPPSAQIQRDCGEQRRGSGHRRLSHHHLPPPPLTAAAGSGGRGRQRDSSHPRRPARPPTSAQQTRGGCWSLGRPAERATAAVGGVAAARPHGPCKNPRWDKTRQRDGWLAGERRPRRGWGKGYGGEGGQGGRRMHDASVKDTEDDGGGQARGAPAPSPTATNGVQRPRGLRLWGAGWGAPRGGSSSSLGLWNGAAVAIRAGRLSRDAHKRGPSRRLLGKKQEPTRAGRTLEMMWGGSSRKSHVSLTVDGRVHPMAPPPSSVRVAKSHSGPDRQHAGIARWLQNQALERRRAIFFLAE